MTCYRDMTFCSGDGCAKFGPCQRTLTEEVKAAAEKFGLPIAQFESPREVSCWRETVDADHPSLFES